VGGPQGRDVIRRPDRSTLIRVVDAIRSGSTVSAEAARIGINRETLRRYVLRLIDYDRVSTLRIEGRTIGRRAE